MGRAYVRPWVTAAAMVALSVFALAGYSLPVAASGGSADSSAQGQITVLTPTVSPGQVIRWTASGLPRNQTLQLLWQTSSGSWKVDGGSLIGDQYTSGEEQIGTVRTSASGTASGSFPVPAGFGGERAFGLATPGGTVIADASLIESISASIAQTTEPQGGFFDLQVKGLGSNGYFKEYTVVYDNHYMGFISGVTTNGTANFQVRAEGVGPHVIGLITGSVEGPYLNAQQSPYPATVDYWFPVTVTSGNPETVNDPEPNVSLPNGDNLTVTPNSGIVGSPLSLQGSGLPKNTSLDVVWHTMAGNRVSSAGYATNTFVLTTVRTDAHGAFTWSGQVPPDLGGPPHEITLENDGQVMGSGEFRIMPAVVSVTPNPVKQGQTFTVHMTGVGWSEYDNIYSVDYDNAFMGYGCGFNSHGDVQMVLSASGGPGVHFIDIYPSPYKSSNPLPNWYGMPQLTYAQDHPGDALPAFHLVIQVEP
jgi:hypothetical protein